MKIDDFIAEAPIHANMGDFRLYDGNIKVGIIHESADLNMEEMSAHSKEVLQRVGNASYYSIVDIRNVFYVSPDIKNWVRSEFAKSALNGLAVIAASFIARQLVARIHKPGEMDIPIQIFRDFDSALAWTTALKAEHEQVKLSA